MTTDTDQRTNFSLKIKDNIGYLTFDTPNKPVNILSSEALKELKGVLEDLHHNNDLLALIIQSAKKGIFIAGADINEIQNIKTTEEGIAAAKAGQDIFNQIEDLPFVSLALINGVTLGGGLELAMSCSYRVASSDASVKIGLPEVKLGIIPGFGGTVRMSALTGLQTAIGLIAAGKAVDARKAFRAGLVDKVCSEALLLQTAMDLLNEKKFKKPKSLRRTPVHFMEKIPCIKNVIGKMAIKQTLKMTKGQYPAPIAAIEAIVQNYQEPREKALKNEAAIFGELIRKKTHQGLIRVFHLTEIYKKDKWVDIESAPITKAGVLGAGVMGGGIAQVLVQHGLPVRLKDVGDEALRLGLKSAEKVFSGLVKKRRMNKCVASAQMHLISPTLDYSGFENCSLVVEAVIEKLEIKKSVFKELEAVVKDDTVLASNTSALPITQIAADLKHPERVVGMHFFNPVHRMPLVEIIRGEKTNDEAVAMIVALCKKIRKTAIVVKDSPGFLVNRLLMPYLNEAGHMFAEGCSYESIDSALFEFGMPMGAFVLLDEIGLDVGFKVATYLEESFGERMKVAPVLKQMCDKGWLGRKSGKGFYIHSGKSRVPNTEMSSIHNSTKEASSQEVIERCLHVMINEAALCIEEKVCRNAGDVDIGMIMGTGFPPFRSGLMHYADDQGLDNIYKALLNKVDQVDPHRFKPAALLKNKAESGSKFYD